MVNYCWKCGIPFENEVAPYHDKCGTFICPNGHCFCSLTSEAQFALDQFAKTYNIWQGNPRKKRTSGVGRAVANIFFEKLKERGIVSTPDEFYRRFFELRESYSALFEEAVREGK